jgi:hypothetical protein
VLRTCSTVGEPEVGLVVETAAGTEAAAGIEVAVCHSGSPLLTGYICAHLNMKGADQHGIVYLRNPDGTRSNFSE